MSNSSARPEQLDFDEIYRGVGPFRAPWDIGEPQPAYVAVERAGMIAGAVLDAGCGTGENALYLANRGYSVTGLDLSPTAIELARTKAARRAVQVDFQVANALELDGYAGRFDTVIDSGLGHMFDSDTLHRYADALHRACRDNAVVHILAVSERGIAEVRSRFTEGADEPDSLPDNQAMFVERTPRKTADELRTAFADGWQAESLEESTLLAQFSAPIGAVKIGGRLGRFRRR